jgi:hypothetical protein
MVIYARSIVSHATTPEQGFAVLGKVVDTLRTEPTVELSLKGIPIASSSFANVFFGGLLEQYTYEEVRKRLEITASNSTMNDVFRRSISKFTAERQAS